MKQTQTKLFDFSDVGLDFCAGSKNLFPDRFKKMFSQGYNTQTVSSVVVIGNQVTLTYGVSHGYVADRVLQVDSGVLAEINDGEFWIDSVTTNTVKFSLDAAPTSIAGGFTTKVASLGWSIVYEQSNIQVYKFKALDESDLYLRLCFQNNLAYRNSVAPCIGKSVNLANGEITDSYALAVNKNITTPASANWEFTYISNNTYNNYTYGQGLAIFGLGRVVGSKYHLAMLFNCHNQVASSRIAGFFPFASVGGYEALNYPALFVEETTAAISATLNTPYGLIHTRAYVGNVRCLGDQIRAAYTTSSRFYLITPRAHQSFTGQDNFNTSIAEPMRLFEAGTDQFLGIISGGLYACSFNSSDAPPFANLLNPSLTADVDLNNLVVMSLLSQSTNLTGIAFFAFPVEEVKIAS